MAKELSVFVDESGDWGEYDYHAPFYIVSFVLHNQADDISKELDYLENKLTDLGFPEHCIHAGPIIRGEEEYRGVNKQTRQKIVKTLMAFMRETQIRIVAFYIEKKHIEDSIEAAGKLGKLISRFIREYYPFFLSLKQKDPVFIWNSRSTNSFVNSVSPQKPFPHTAPIFSPIIETNTCEIRVGSVKTV